MTAAGSRLEYNCAVGTIGEPLVTSSSGQFTATGTHKLESGGPPGPGAPVYQPQAARFEGSVNGNSMKLTVRLQDTGAQVGTFDLTLGAPPALDKCV